MSGAILPLPQYVFMEWCSVNQRDNFTFTFTGQAKSISSVQSVAKPREQTADACGVCLKTVTFKQMIWQHCNPAEQAVSRQPSCLNHTIACFFYVQQLYCKVIHTLGSHHIKWTCHRQVLYISVPDIFLALRTIVLDLKRQLTAAWRGTTETTGY
jgi:hypothetical protein